MLTYNEGTVIKQCVLRQDLGLLVSQLRVSCKPRGPTGLDEHVGDLRPGDPRLPGLPRPHRVPTHAAMNYG